MKHIEARARMDPAEAPKFFDLLANSEEITEARVLDVNTTLEGVDNYLFAIDGDPSTFAAEATDTPGVESVELSATRDGTTYALVVVRSLEAPVYDSILRASSRSALVIRTPIVYRDGAMFGRGVGDPEPLQEALADTPDAVDVQIDVVGEFRGEDDDPARRLSEQQRAAVEAALEMGYYEQPREATHEDVAAALDVAPQTASDHLQKAEAKFVRAGMGAFGPDL